jgi:hypothetical protein
VYIASGWPSDSGRRDPEGYERKREQFGERKRSILELARADSTWTMAEANRKGRSFTRRWRVRMRCKCGLSWHEAPQQEEYSSI